MRRRPPTVRVLALASLCAVALTSGPASAARLTYDSANRLVRAEDEDQTTSYTYDGRGNLVQVCTQEAELEAQCSRLLIDDQTRYARVIGEVPTDGSPGTVFAYGPRGVVSARTEDQTLVALSDHQASVRGWVDASTGEVASRIAYDAFGRTRASVGDPPSIGYTGEWTSPNDFVWLRARTYVTALGRFPQRDTFDGHTDVPLSLNRYTYGHSNPLTNVDPSGHAVEAAWDAASLGIGLLSIASWNEDTPWWQKGLDVVGVGLDAAALALPFIPGGAGYLGRTAGSVPTASISDQAGLVGRHTAADGGIASLRNTRPGSGGPFLVDMNTGRSAFIAGNDARFLDSSGVTMRATRRNGAHADLANAMGSGRNNRVGGFLTKRGHNAYDAAFVSGQANPRVFRMGAGRIPLRSPTRTAPRVLHRPAAQHMANTLRAGIYGEGGQLLARPARYVTAPGVVFHLPGLPRTLGYANSLDFSFPEVQRPLPIFRTRPAYCEGQPPLGPCG